MTADAVARTRWQHARGLARAGGLLLAAVALGAWLALDALHARAHELVGDAGAQLLAYGRHDALDGARTLLVNGLALRVLSGTTADGPGQVLDTLAGRCRARAGQLPLQLQEHARARLPPRIAARAFDPVLRLADERGGFLGCLDLGAQRLDPSELLARARRFAVHGDVAEFGALRFVWTQREARATRWVALWSDGPLPLATAFPARGDAPGIDPPGLPRPRAARRILSAWQAGSAPLLVSYETAVPAQRALDDYAASLRAQRRSLQLGPAESDGTRWLIATDTGASASATASHAVIVAPRARGALLTVTPL